MKSSAIILMMLGPLLVGCGSFEVSSSCKQVLHRFAEEPTATASSNMQQYLVEKKEHCPNFPKIIAQAKDMAAKKCTELGATACRSTVSAYQVAVREFIRLQTQWESGHLWAAIKVWLSRWLV